VRNAIAGSRRLAVVGLIALVAAAALASVAFGAKAGPYKGKTVSAKMPVSFRLNGGKVRNFQGGISIYCPGNPVTGTFGTYRYDAVIPPRALAVKNSRFNYKGDDRTGVNDIEIHGRFVSARKAKGWIQFGGGGCAGKTDFWATLRN